MNSYDILLTNDDGIDSPGLLAAVEAVKDCGNITVVAPTFQQTGAGRGLTGDKNAVLKKKEYQVNGSVIPAYHCDCSPALIVRHCLRTLFVEKKPDLLISGINYGENLGINITSSGTVGAALESASVGIPGIAISKQTDTNTHHLYSEQDWAATCFFLKKFTKHLIEREFHEDVEVLKIDVPEDATPSTDWKITSLAKTVYYTKIMDNPCEHTRIGEGKLCINVDTGLSPDTDIYAFAVDKLVSVTPLSVDLTSRVELSQLEDQLRKV